MENELIRRFIELRKNQGLTQANFGKLMGLSDGTISMIESGQRPISEKHIKLVCGTLGVNEAWFRDGVGPMFTEEAPGEKQLLEAFRQLSPAGRKAAIKLIEALLDSELERAFDEGYRAGNRGLAKEETSQNAPGGAAKPLEALETAKGEESTNKEINPIHSKDRA